METAMSSTWTEQVEESNEANTATSQCKQTALGSLAGA